MILNLIGQPAVKYYPEAEVRKMNHKQLMKIMEQNNWWQLVPSMSREEWELMPDGMLQSLIVTKMKEPKEEIKVDTTKYHKDYHR